MVTQDRGASSVTGEGDPMSQEAKVLELERRFYEIEDITGIDPWQVLRQWAFDEGWGGEYVYLEYALRDKLRDSLKEQWAQQLNDADPNDAHSEHPVRRVSTQFLWRNLQLMWTPIPGGRELRPTGFTEVPNQLLFDRRLGNREFRL